MEKILSFLREVSLHNDREWFLAHKDEYVEAKNNFDALALQFMAGIAKFDPRCKGLELKDCTYRFYRDIRFSPDKRPYKTHFGVYVCPGGKKSGRAGYYLHLQPDENLYFICAGLYNPTPEVLHSIRDEVAGGGGQAIREALDEAPDFWLPWDKALQRIPKGWNPTDDYAEFYRLRSFEFCKELSEEDVRAVRFVDHCVRDLKKTYAFNEILNRCVDFIEEP